jgi:hypothetical protein
MNFPNTDFKNPSVLFFYKGTAFPQIVDIPNLVEKMTKSSNDMIIRGIKNGFTIEQQKKDYKEQLDLWEQTLCVEAKGMEMDDDSIDRAMVSMGFDNRQMFYSMWCLNICALLKMKVINNDNENGILIALTK